LSRRTRSFIASACAIALLGTSAAAAAAAATHTAIEDPIPAPLAQSNIKVQLDQVASGLASPVAATFAPGVEDSLFVADQTGQIWQVDVSDDGHGRHPAKTLFADVSSRLVALGAFGIGYDERGLLGLAFHPDFKKNGLVYTYTSEPPKGVADFSTGTWDPAYQAVPYSADDVGGYHQSVVTEWRVKNSRGGQLQVDPSSAREVMRVDEPEFNHNGGALVFGNDKTLFIALGDGGQADDVARGHVPGGNAQSLAPGNVLGKILRIDPLGRNAANGRYGIPANNPKTGGEREIYAYGFRNPYRMSVDRKTGALWVGDVGQNDLEEVEQVKAGGNYGWPVKEGTFLFAPTGGCVPRVNGDVKGCVFADSPGAPANMLDPLAQYDHTEDAGATEVRVAVVGGFVARGDDMGRLSGRYVFGDYSTEIGEPVAGHLFYLDSSNKVKEVGVKGRPGGLGLAVLGFGTDAKGNIYLLANGSGTLADPGFAVSPGTSGEVLRISADD
jgi:glucose/arabinose dehydrogenase